MVPIGIIDALPFSVCLGLAASRPPGRRALTTEHLAFGLRTAGTRNWRDVGQAHGVGQGVL